MWPPLGLRPNSGARGAGGAGFGTRRGEGLWTLVLSGAGLVLVLEEEGVMLMLAAVGTLGVGVVRLVVLLEVLLEEGVLAAGAGLVFVVSGAGLGLVLVLVVVYLGHDLLSVLFSEVDFVAERGRACADEDEAVAGDLAGEGGMSGLVVFLILMLVLVSVLRGTETLVDGEDEGTAVGLVENGFAGGLTDSVLVLLLPFVFVGAALGAEMVVVLRAGVVEVAGREGVRELEVGAGPVPLLL